MSGRKAVAKIWPPASASCSTEPVPSAACQNKARGTPPPMPSPRDDEKAMRRPSGDHSGN
jgi:hypothetical protein